MSAIKAIYDASVTYCTAEQIGTVGAYIDYNGKTFSGQAVLHPDDKDFFSIRVGKNIAKSRARINALKYAYENAKDRYKYRNEMYYEVFNRPDEDEPDPTGRFWHHVLTAKHNMQDLRAALKEEQRRLNYYLTGQDAAIQSIKRIRAKANKKPE